MSATLILILCRYIRIHKYVIHYKDDNISLTLFHFHFPDTVSGLMYADVNMQVLGFYKVLHIIKFVPGVSDTDTLERVVASDVPSLI